MTIKNDAKFEEELTSRFKIDTANWQILTRALECLKNLHFDGLLLTKVLMFELTKYRRVMFDGTKNWSKFQGELTCAFKNDIRNLADFHSLKK